MLDGKEIVKKIGNSGEASVDVTAEGKVIVEVAVKHEVDLVGALEAYVAKTENKTDDKALAAFKTVIGFLKATKG